MKIKVLYSCLLCLLLFFEQDALAQCSQLEPGFAFLSSSRGCAPFSVRIETLYLSSASGTKYFVNWGDGTREETYTQTNSVGVIIEHTYPDYSIECGYDLTIDAENSCNPRGSVVPITSQVIVWTSDVISITPREFRVCQGYATSVRFTDNSQWNCFPRATRENNEPRWIQWIYGTGSAASRIPGMRINNVSPGIFPYTDPAPGRNPIYPVTSPGQLSLPVNVPATTPADIGKEFIITLKNWNQCNAYDNLLADGNAFNPVNGNLINGDNAPQIATARVVIVDSPEPAFATRFGGASGPLQTTFCIGDNIYFDNTTPAISGASFRYTWEFFDNPNGTGSPLASRTQANPTFSYTRSGLKFIRLRVKDTNAAGDCESVIESTILISPSIAAQIAVTDGSGNALTPDFCQEANAPLTNFAVRFVDASLGTATASTIWRWEFYDENNALVFEAPAGGGFSTTPLGPFDRIFTNKGVYKVRFKIRDNITSCESEDEVQVRVSEKPAPAFTFNRVCEGNAISFSDQSTINPLSGDQIILREWDMNYDGTTFTKDAALDNEQTFDYDLGAAGTHNVALRVTSTSGCAALIVHPVIVDALPQVTFTPDVTSGCSKLRVTFINNGSLTQAISIERFVWEVDAGDGFEVDSIQYPANPNFSTTYTRDFINTGTSNKIYTIRLRCITINNCERISSSVTITVFPGTSSGFNPLNYSPFNDNCSPVPVNFSATSETQLLNPTNYSWVISDATGVVSETSTGTTPTFNYTFTNSSQSVKDFQIRLRATLAGGCYGDSTRTIRISPVPVSDFTVDTLESDCKHKLLRFNATQRGLSKYQWTISIEGVIMQNTSSASEFITYDFQRISDRALPVAVSLKATNFANCESQGTSKNLRIPKLDNINTSFSVSPTTVTIPNSTVTITNTTNPGPWKYHWDFGDNKTSDEATVKQHTYVKHGIYTITLTVTNNVCREEQSVTVVVNPTDPQLDFAYNPPSGCAPLKVTFTNSSLYADQNSYFWQFGTDEGTSRAVNPTYTYYEPGVYSVTLSATNATGDTVRVTKSAIIHVLERPSAQFGLKPQLVNIPGGKLFTDNYSFGAVSYLWDFGDGALSTDYEPIHEYKSEGVFSVTMIATNSLHCTDTAKAETAVRVVNSGQLLVPNAFSPGLAGPSNMGQNDVFLPLMRQVKEFNLMIFNRWGELLFESGNPTEGWDGYYHGKLCPQDVYVYKIVARFENGEMVTKVGDVHLMR